SNCLSKVTGLEKSPVSNPYGPFWSPGCTRLFTFWVLSEAENSNSSCASQAVRAKAMGGLRNNLGGERSGSSGCRAAITSHARPQQLAFAFIRLSRFISTGIPSENCYATFLVL